MRGFRQTRWERGSGILEPLVFELGKIGEGGKEIARVEDELRKEIGPVEDIVLEGMLREELPLPGLTEVEVARHYNHLAQMNYGVDSGPYWLGSCTMKYTPKLVMRLASHPSVRRMHPYSPPEVIGGLLEILYDLQQMLAAITGLPHFTLQPAAGAQGEFLGALMIRRRLEDLGERRDEMIIPDSAHGSNFASASMAGFKVIRVPPSEDGTVDLSALKAAINERTAGMMITNPNTLGIFEDRILEIAELLHSNGSYLYYDGANLNAIMGWVRLSDMGVDIAHLNLHKTFSSPHGGGGPGSGAVGVTDEFSDYRPVPVIERQDGAVKLVYNLPRSVGKVRSFLGNVPVLIRAWAYLKLLGGKGVREAAGVAVLNANYARRRLMEAGFSVPFGANRPCKHEFVLSLADIKKDTGVRAMDFAKALIDRGLHPPTMYFPIIVEEAFMMEPTESDSLEEIDDYVEAMMEIKRDAYENPEILKEAPRNSSISRLDEGLANRRLWLTWRMYKESEGDRGQ